MHKYFPKLCAPYCGLELNFRRIRENPDITVHARAEVTDISGQYGDFTLKVKQQPQMVNANCTACGKCVMSCPTGALFYQGSTASEMERDRTKLEYIVNAREKKEWNV